MRRQITTEYFGGTEPLTPETTPVIRSALEFDDKGVNNIAKLVFNGMKANPTNSTNDLTREDLRMWTKAIMDKKYPGKEFNEANFEKGFSRMDVNKDGKINIEDIKIIVLKKVKKENLYVGKS